MADRTNWKDKIGYRSDIEGMMSKRHGKPRKMLEDKRREFMGER